MAQLTSCSGLTGTSPRYACLTGRPRAWLAHRSAPFHSSRCLSSPCCRRGRLSHQLQLNAVASVDKAASSDANSTGTVEIDNKADKKYSTILVKAPQRSGLLSGLTDILAQNGLDVCKATVDNSNGTSINQFLVVGSNGGKVENAQELRTLQQALESAISPQSTGRLRPKLKNADKSVAEDKKNFLYTLMGMPLCLLHLVFMEACGTPERCFCLQTHTSQVMSAALSRALSTILSTLLLATATRCPVRKLTLLLHSVSEIG